MTELPALPFEVVVGLAAGLVVAAVVLDAFAETAAGAGAFPLAAGGAALAGSARSSGPRRQDARRRQFDLMNESFPLPAQGVKFMTIRQAPASTPDNRAILWHARRPHAPSSGADATRASAAILGAAG